MSKVYSFRLDGDNPREAQAIDVVDTWVSQGYSLRFLVVDALISYKNVEVDHKEFRSIVDHLREMILSMDKMEKDHHSNVVLLTSFLLAVKKTATVGITSK